MRVLIVVTHLLGTGHLSRALTLARAFQGAGHTVRLVSGGMPVPHLDSEGLQLIQLPPLRSDGVDFTRLMGADGTIADAAYLMNRQHMLIEVLTIHPPDVLITELFPFGRRNLAAEFVALLDAANAMSNRPITLASIRDILAPPSRPEKATRADDLIARYYDGVLVHSDPRATRLEQSWPVTDRLRQKLFYTGFVAPPLPKPAPGSTGQDEVLVSAGGGAVGQELFRTAIAASRLGTRTWRLLVGGADLEPRIAALQTQAKGAPVIIEALRSDFRQLLTRVACSVSMAGYNTALDILQSGVPAVLIPFDAGSETEQGLRASGLSNLPAIQVIRSGELTPENLTTAVASAVQQGRRDGSDLCMDGAADSVRIAENLVRNRT